MDELIQQMKVVLADTVTFYQKTHQYHWNVEGSDFYLYHLMFERIYTEVYGAVDGIGEQIRALDGYAPYSPQRIAELTTLNDSGSTSEFTLMVRSLYADNQKVMSTLMSAYKLAERYNEIGLSNFLQDRYNAHKIHHYMLRSSMKGEQE
jgi:starvation-inducible DNA-binding protein